MKKNRCLVTVIVIGCLCTLGCTSSPREVEKALPVKENINQEIELQKNTNKGGGAAVSDKQIRLSQDEKVAFDTFFSNFSEAGVEEFPLNPSNETLLSFGVKHNLLNRKYAQKKEQGYILIPGEEVEKSVYKYFGRPVKLESLSRTPFENGHFKVTRYFGENISFSQIVSLAERRDGLREAIVNVYTAPEAFNGDVHSDESKWTPGNSISVPKKIASYKAVIEKSPQDNKRYILKTYTLLKKYN